VPRRYVARNCSGADLRATIPLPPDARTGGAPVTAHFFVRPAFDGEWDWANDTRAAVRAHRVGSARLTERRLVRSRADAPRKLLEEDAPSDEGRDVGLHVSHWRFGTWPLVLRILDVGGDGGLDAAEALYEDGLRNLGVGLASRRTRAGPVYMPAVHVDETLALASHALPLSRNASTSDPTLRLRVAKQGPLPFALRVTVATQLIGMASTLMGEADVDEIRYQISDKRVFRFVARQLVSVLHVAFDYLAFSEDVGFYVGRETFHGVSAATLLWGLARDLVIYLYLLDADAGKLVLWGLVMSLATDVFKIQKVLRPRLVLTRRGPRVRFAELQTAPEKATAKYDAEATAHLYLATWPILAGFTWYSLVHDVHKGYYSWLVGSAADLVYYFGFVMMTPQLWINYKLKSVAHLPVKVFAYKIFNTFIDDAFAWIVDMPLKHRLMTLRDDVVFVVFLYQWWTYRVDATRPNEYGRAYEGGAPATTGDGAEADDDDDGAGPPG